MHDIWNPWHGCKKISEGCKNCYMFYLDKTRSNKSGAEIYKTKTNFNYPLQKDKAGNYKIKSGEKIRICMTSDFFLEEADKWREDVWQIIKSRSDVIFFILTKRADRIEQNLPFDWNDGYENVILSVTAENQKRADERIPILLNLKAKHRGVMVAPFIAEVNLDKYLATGKIEQVICGGENYDGSRPCDFNWVKKLSNDCKKYNTTFCFIETGTFFLKDKKMYHIKSKDVQSRMAYKANVNFKGKEIEYKLVDKYNSIIPKEKLYIPYFNDKCNNCGSKIICNGCDRCGRCNNQEIM